ncbi:MAG: type II toxin-antitoxin system RelE/ParE family toxin [Dongiaceae bacterium]
MRKLVIADRARADLKEIADYTGREWGAGQSGRYLWAIKDRLARLRDHPGLGSLRAEIGPGYRSVRSGRHIVFYRETAESIEIVRILHERMDMHRQLRDRDVEVPAPAEEPKEKATDKE